MRWKPKVIVHPKPGDTRRRKIFAWQPTVLHNGEKVFLGYYNVLERFTFKDWSHLSPEELEIEENSGWDSVVFDWRIVDSE